MGENRRDGCCQPMDLFRSEPMQLVQLIVPIESAQLTVSYLGDLALLQFKDVQLGELEVELIKMNANSEKLQRTYNELVEYKLIMQKAGEFFKAAQMSATSLHGEAESRQFDDESIDTPLLTDQEMSTDFSKQVKLGFITGLVPRAKSMAFERILFRATRGNVFLKQSNVDDLVTDPVSGEKVIIKFYRSAFEPIYRTLSEISLLYSLYSLK